MKKFEVNDILSWRNFQKFEGEEIEETWNLMEDFWSWRNLNLKKFKFEEIFSSFLMANYPNPLTSFLAHLININNFAFKVKYILGSESIHFEG